MIDNAKEYSKQYPPDYNEPSGVGEILRTGKSELIPEITDEMLVAGIKDPKQLEFIRSLQLGFVHGSATHRARQNPRCD